MKHAVYMYDHVCIHNMKIYENKHNAGAIANEVAKDTSTGHPYGDHQPDNHVCCAVGSSWFLTTCQCFSPPKLLGCPKTHG